jgi:hypothetical protein
MNLHVLVIVLIVLLYSLVHKKYKSGSYKDFITIFIITSIVSIFSYLVTLESAPIF